MRLRWTCALAIAALMTAGALLGGCADVGSKDDAGQAADDAAAAASSTRTVTDSAGNQIAIPGDVERAAPSIGAFAQVTEMLTQGNGKIVAAATKQISADFKAVFPDYEQSNPQGRDSRSVEDLITAQAQVVYGPSSIFSDEQRDQMSKAGIAVVNLDNFDDVEGMCESIQTIGDILGSDESAMAQKFNDYYREGIADAQKRTSGVKDEGKPKILQVNERGGSYMCTNKDDISQAYYTAAGAVNVAADYPSSKGGMSPTVDTEQIVTWNPDYIIAMSAQAKDAVMADSSLAGVKAVKDGKVLVCPTGLYLWCVRSGEGAMMTPWLGTILHPDLFSDVDMAQVVQDFYQTYYHASLSAEEARKILAGA